MSSSGIFVGRKAELERRTKLKATIFVLCAALITVVATIFLRDRFYTSKGMIISRYPLASLKVVNGLAYEQCVLDISGYESLTVPSNAIVRQGSIEGSIEICLEKELAFLGHPPYPMHIRDARKYMGCAYRIDGRSMVIATYGEWDSHIEGGSSIRMLFIVPKGLSVKKEEGLSGENSMGHATDPELLIDMMDSPEFKKCFWYGPVGPGDGWTKIETSVDTEFTKRWKIR
ncbi:MAG: hypothetical protein ACYTEL_16330 [Planctomycetota bacterium]|jgi:hypothetical protein